MKNLINLIKNEECQLTTAEYACDILAVIFISYAIYLV